VQRDLYAAFLAAFLSTANDIPSCARYHVPWEGAEACLRVAQERLEERAKEGQHVPRSFGIARAGARLPKNRGEATQEPLFLLKWGRLEAWKHRPEPSLLSHGEPSDLPVLDSHNSDEIGNIDSDEKSTHPSRDLPIPDKSQKRQVNHDHDR
jgi:hypothetical protein